MRESRTPTAIEVNLIDVSQLERDALAYHMKTHPDCGYTEMKAGCIPLGFVLTQKGMFLIDHEGTGDSRPVTSANKGEIFFYGREERDGHKFGCVVPEVQDDLDQDELSLLATGKKLNLADFVRSQNSRLDANYEAWRKFLESAGEIKSNKEG